MAASNATRQRAYRDRCRRDGSREVRVVLDHQDEARLRGLARHFQCTQKEMVRWLVLREWERQKNRMRDGVDG